MPLGAQKLEKKWLPSTKDKPEAEREFVVLDVTMVAGTFVGVEKHESNTERTAAALANSIKDWNVKDETGAIAAVTYDNILRLDLDDFLYLQTCVGKSEDEQVAGVPEGLKEI